MNAQPLLKKQTAALSFKALTLADRAVLEPVFARHPRRISGFTFAALFSWNGTYSYEWAMPAKDTVILSCRLPGEAGRDYLQPVGDFGPAHQQSLLADMAGASRLERIFGVEADFLERYPGFCSHFRVENDPALANYVYRASDLVTLPGKFYAKKRNLIAQGSALYAWQAYPLTPLHIPDALDILDRTDVAHDGEERWLHERAAVRTALLNHADLGQKGVLIVADGKPAAFLIFEATGPDMAVVHFEKADRRHKGLYQIVNQETAKAIVAEGHSYINREEDMGIDGLRQAKHSYGPIEVVPSYTLTTI